MPGPRTAVRTLATALMGSALLLAGCWTPGGRPWSDDSYTYVSTEWQPQTISLIDTRTGQTVWSYEVPVGRQLVMQFYEGSRETAPDYLNPDTLAWDDFPAGQHLGFAKNRLSVPPATARRVDVKFRPTPETAPPPPSGPGTAGYGASAYVPPGQ